MKQASLQMAFMYMYFKFQGFLEISLFQKYERFQIHFSKNMSSHSLICIHFIPLNRHESKLLCGIYCVYEVSRGIKPPSRFCDHSKIGLID